MRFLSFFPASMGRLLALVCCIAAAHVSLTASASAQGLLEFLFGRSAPQVYAPPSGPASGLEEGQGARRAVRLREPQKPPPYAPPEVMPGPLGQFLRDPTLRRGDVVATAHGLMVYRGPGGSQHRPADFMPVASEAAGAPWRRPELEALDRIARRQPSLVETTPIAYTAAASPAPALGEQAPVP